MAALLCGLEAGDEVILSDPGYACYPNFIRFVDGMPVPVKVEQEDGFQYRPQAASCLRQLIGVTQRTLLVGFFIDKAMGLQPFETVSEDICGYTFR